jgi:hypothetical protein
MNLSIATIPKDASRHFGYGAIDNYEELCYAIVAMIEKSGGDSHTNQMWSLS